MKPFEQIRGHEKLLAIFGYWPTFHAVEVVSKRLDRAGFGSPHGPTLYADVHTLAGKRDPADQKQFTFEKHSIVGFRFEDVCDLDLDGFNHQNAILGLEFVEQARPDMPGVSGFRVTFD